MVLSFPLKFRLFFLQCQDQRFDWSNLDMNDQSYHCCCSTNPRFLFMISHDCSCFLLQQLVRDMVIISFYCCSKSCVYFGYQRMIWAGSAYVINISLSENQRLSQKIKLRYGQSASIWESEVISKCYFSLLGECGIMQ